MMSHYVASKEKSHFDKRKYHMAVTFLQHPF